MADPPLAHALASTLAHPHDTRTWSLTRLLAAPVMLLCSLGNLGALALLLSLQARDALSWNAFLILSVTVANPVLLIACVACIGSSLAEPFRRRANSRRTVANAPSAGGAQSPPPPTAVVLSPRTTRGMRVLGVSLLWLALFVPSFCAIVAFALGAQGARVAYQLRSAHSFVVTNVSSLLSGGPSAQSLAAARRSAFVVFSDVSAFGFDPFGQFGGVGCRKKTYPYRFCASPVLLTNCSTCAQPQRMSAVENDSDNLSSTHSFVRRHHSISVRSSDFINSNSSNSTLNTNMNSTLPFFPLVSSPSTFAHWPLFFVCAFDGSSHSETGACFRRFVHAVPCAWSNASHSAVCFARNSSASAPFALAAVNRGVVALVDQRRSPAFFARAHSEFLHSHNATGSSASSSRSPSPLLLRPLTTEPSASVEHALSAVSRYRRRQVRAHATPQLVATAVLCTFLHASGLACVLFAVVAFNHQRLRAFATQRYSYAPLSTALVVLPSVKREDETF